MQFSKQGRRKKIHYRIRRKIAGTAAKPRLAVYRSNKFIYCQAIDDVNGVTLVSASSREEGIIEKGNKSEQSKEVGKRIAERLKEKNLEGVVFDRGGYLYHGRVKALAEGIREGGIKL